MLQFLFDFIFFLQLLLDFKKKETPWPDSPTAQSVHKENKFDADWPGREQMREEAQRDGFPLEASAFPSGTASVVASRRVSDCSIYQNLVPSYYGAALSKNVNSTPTPTCNQKFVSRKAHVRNYLNSFFAFFKRIPEKSLPKWNHIHFK